MKIRIGVEPVPHQAQKSASQQGSISVFHATEDPPSGISPSTFHTVSQGEVHDGVKSAAGSFSCIGWRARGPVVHKKCDRTGPERSQEESRAALGRGKIQRAAPDLTIIRLQYRGGPVR